MEALRWLMRIIERDSESAPSMVQSRRFCQIGRLQAGSDQAWRGHGKKRRSIIITIATEIPPTISSHTLM